MEKSHTIKLEKAVSIAEMKTATLEQAYAIRVKSEINHLRSRQPSNSYQHVRKGQEHRRGNTGAHAPASSSSSQFGKGQQNQNTHCGRSKQQSRCSICGYANHEQDKCFFKNKYCNICNKKGHIATVCSQKGRKWQNNYLNDENKDIILLSEVEQISVSFILLKIFKEY